MADNETPLVANRGQTPYIPTGYEALGQAVTRKRRIADALMAQGMQGPGAGAQSWAQLLGSLAQVWAGKTIQKSADKEQAENEGRQRQEVASYQQAFESDLANGAGYETLSRKWGGNPYVKDRLAPLEKAWLDKTKNEGEFGAPTTVLDEAGNRKTILTSKGGTQKELGGGFQLPPVISNVNNMAIDLQGQKSGTVLPQPAMDAVILGPDGKPKLNSTASEFQIAKATAGSPKISVETKVNTANLSDAATKRLESTLNSGLAGAKSIAAADRIDAAVKSGVLSSGPLSSAKNYFDQLFGTNKEGVKQRRIAEQAFAELNSQARKYIEGQGSVTESEAAAVAKAYGGDINSLTLGEIQAISAVARRSGQAAIDSHNDQLEAAEGLDGSDQYLPSFQLPEAYRRKTYGKPPAARAASKAPVAAPRKGLPPKGATTVTRTSTATPANKYADRLPKGD